jgi:uncharacterized LabA/DUF88 family protein
MAEPYQLLEREKKAIAILIDGDNAQPSLVKEMLAEASKYGRTTLRRIYGDWTTPNMNGWKETLQENAIHPVQQFRNTVGKNATDSAMIIDAMDILHAGTVAGFCVVSSDSDYTRLATRIREKGVFVMGIGRQKTPKSFTNACDVFVFSENLAAQPENVELKSKAQTTTATLPSSKALPLLKKAFGIVVQEDGWATLSSIGNALRNLDPSFDPRTYGCANLKTLVGKFSSTIEMSENKRENGTAVVSIKFK